MTMPLQADVVDFPVALTGKINQSMPLPLPGQSQQDDTNEITYSLSIPNLLTIQPVLIVGLIIQRECRSHESRQLNPQVYYSHDDTYQY